MCRVDTGVIAKFDRPFRISFLNIMLAQPLYAVSWRPCNVAVLRSFCSSGSRDGHHHVLPRLFKAKAVAIFDLAGE
jgi:hypothetical protein